MLRSLRSIRWTSGRPAANWFGVSFIIYGIKIMKILFLVGLTLISFKSMAAFYTGNDIYNMCKTEKSSATYYQNSSSCNGYVVGVYDHIIGTTKSGVLCIGSGVTAGQVVKMFLKYSEDNPSKLNKPAELLVENAIYEAFKCKKN